VGNPLLERMDLMAPDEIDNYRSILRRIRMGSDSSIDPQDRQAILKLAYGYIEPRHRLGLLDEELQAAIVSVRQAFRDNLPRSLRMRLSSTSRARSIRQQAYRTTCSSDVSSTPMLKPLSA
jgi:putative ABC transport system ATP-binding protein